jgi:glycosyltransferase involved in cell wall biosynthesis
VASVRARLRPGAHQRRLPPFIDTEPFRAARRCVAPDNAKGPPLLLSVGMMRARAKLASYRVLAEALTLLKDRPWRALLVGDGPARAEVEALMAPLGTRVRFAGVVPHEALPALYADADLYLWPAIDEAFGMAFLEAQAAGLPVIAGRTGGVPAVVAEDVSGLLTPIGDARAFASAVARLLDAPVERARLAAGARARIAAHHDERAAAHALAAALRTLR